MADGAQTFDDFDTDAALNRLAALDLSATEHVHARLMAAEDAKDVAELGRTYQRMSRCLRQTLALKAQLKRDRERAAEAPASSRKPGGVAVAKRIRELREGVRRVVWDEAEDAEAADWFTEELDTVILEEMREDSFCDETLDDHVARVCLALGLDPARVACWRDLPDPPADGYGRDAERTEPPDTG